MELQGASKPVEAGPAIDDLPPHVASSILGLLPFEERHRAPPLVCSRWRALVAASPELRREVALFLPSRRVLAGLRALAAWLRRGAAADVQRMRLCLHAPLPGTDAASQAALADSPASADEEQRAGEALADALAGLLAACSGPASALRQLDLSIEAAPLVVARQLAAALQGLPHLQRLSIGLHRYGGLRLATPLAGLPALRALSLSASPEPMPPLHPSEAATSEDGALQARCRQRGLQYCCGGAACVSDGHAAAVGLEVLRAEHPCFVALLQNAALPRGLTRLCLSGLAGLSLPEELALLPCLRSLSLDNLRLPAEGYAPLAWMPALRRLRLARCLHQPSPDCLRQLSSLQELHLVAGSPPCTSLFGADPRGPDDQRNWCESSSRQLASTLAHLPAMGSSLCRLVLTGELSGLSAADLAPLAELHGLSSLCLWPAGREGGISSGGSCASSPFAAALPSGAWLRCLAQLAAPAQALQACQGFMHGACQLEALALQGCSEADAAWLARLAGWAATHPTLRRLCIDCPVCNCHERQAATGGDEAMRRCGHPVIELGDALAHELLAF